MNATSRETPERRLPCLSPAQASLVRAYLETRVAEQVPLKELAGLVHLSIGHFCRAFKGSFRLRPRLYMTQRRMELAKELMLRDTRPLSQVALDCGMVDQSHFSRTFRRVTGQSPGAWRRRMRSTLS
jgi:AraC-like DNA-binding protein